MKILNHLAVAFLFATVISCADKPTNTSQSITIPEPTLVEFSKIPSFDSPVLYRSGGAAIKLLQSALDAGFDVRRAWHPNIALCMGFFLDEVIIELGAPDAEMANLGFSQDFAESAGGCFSHWDQYDFIQSNRSGK